MVLRSLPILFCSLLIHSVFGQPVKETFQLAQLLTKVGDERAWHLFIDRPTIRAGIYYVSTTRPDTQHPHHEDELYCIVEGKGQLQVGDTIINITPGMVIFVRAGIEHRFVNIAIPVKSIVLFSKAQSTKTDPIHSTYSLETMATKANPTKNVWEPFHNCNTMMFGLYLLPKALGGDGTLTHKWDELNIVVKGSADFTVDGLVQRVRKDDLVFVAQGHGHNFSNLSEDFEVLILFEKKSTP